MKSAVDWRLGLWWSLATIGGLVLGLIIGCTFGLGCAVMQWLALRRLVSAWWIAATFVAWAIFWAINLAGFLGSGSGVFGKVIEGLGHGALFGALLGLFQWLVLRNKIRNANWWIYANILGWSSGAALGDGIKAALGSEDPIEFVVVFIVSTVVTAITLVRMFRNRDA
jgi:hypothetical protein